MKKKLYNKKLQFQLKHLYQRRFHNNKKKIKFKIKIK